MTPARFERIAPGIYYAGCFIQPDDTTSIRSEVESWVDWTAAHAGRYKDDKIVESNEIKELRDVLVSRRELPGAIERCLRIGEAVNQANKLFDVDGITPSRYVVSKYIEGCHIRPHTDTDFFNTPRIYTGVYYLNDDYAGGEIHFPAFQVSLRPSRGSLLLFLSEYLHGVSAILSGIRYSIVWFGNARRQ